MNVNDLIGVPYEFNDRARGMNCWDLCIEVSRRAGINLPRIEMPPFETSEAGISTIIEREKENFRELKNPEPLAIVVFSLQRPWVSHLGIVLDDGKRFLHTFSKIRNSCVERLDHRFWSRRIAGYYKWTGK